MTTKLRLLCFLLLANLLFAYPVTEDSDEDVNPEEIGDYFEGDMDLDEEQMRAFLYPNQRNILRNEKYRWPGSVVHYEVDNIFEKKHIDAIRSALNKIEAVTCLKFLPRQKTTKAYILVKGEPSGCHSSVGFRGAQQIVNLHINEPGKGCFRPGTIQHEFLHALGFYHQQSASNRDNYVAIIKENIMDNKEHNFLKQPASLVTDFGVTYDYGSIMHYSAMSFSKNGKPTIVPYDKTAKIGQRERLSEGDLKKLNAMYKCPGY